MRVAILSIIASLLLLAPDSQALLPSLRLLPKQIDGKLPARRTRISGNALDEGQLSLMETDCCIQGAIFV